MSAFSIAFPTLPLSLSSSSSFLPTFWQASPTVGPDLIGALTSGSDSGSDGKGNSTPSSGPDTSQPWWQIAVKDGTGLLGTVLGYELQKQQIGAGQTPSIGYNASGAPQGQSVAAQIAAQKGAASLGLGAALGGSSIFLIIGLVVLFLLIGRR